MTNNLLRIVRRVLGMHPDPPNAPVRVQERLEMDQRQLDIATRLRAAGVDAEVVTRTIEMHNRERDRERG